LCKNCLADDDYEKNNGIKKIPYNSAAENADAQTVLDPANHPELYDPIGKGGYCRIRL